MIDGQKLAGSCVVLVATTMSQMIGVLPVRARGRGMGRSGDRERGKWKVVMFSLISETVCVSVCVWCTAQLTSLLLLSGCVLAASPRPSCVT